jgi:lipoprotein NlpD
MPAFPCRWAAVALLVVMITGCAQDPATPTPAEVRPRIVDQSMSLRQAESPYRIVVRGDTLYSIAWEAGRDYRELATWNSIRPPYTIRPGQELRVLPPGPSEAGSAQAKGTRPAATGTAKSKAKTGRTTAKAATPAARPVPSPVKPGSGSATGSKRPAKRNTAASAPVGSWAWPADGQIITRYGDGDSKGLDIAGARAASIRAAANGRVVYLGSGLRGYGQLIIIKHSEEFLSAYAHNDRVYVKEGDVVKRGQRIADMGSSGTDRVKLHFEIRRRGVPIDPLQYLPKR